MVKFQHTGRLVKGAKAHLSFFLSFLLKRMRSAWACRYYFQEGAATALTTSFGELVRPRRTSPVRVQQLGYLLPCVDNARLQLRVGVLPEVDEPTVIGDRALRVAGIPVQLSQPVER
jgi:hypothetical protein